MLTGPNGAGKTNLLEAVSFLAPGRGLRGARLTEIDRRRAGRVTRDRAVAAGAWAVAAAVDDAGAARCGSAPAAIAARAASAGWCASTASRRAARRRSASVLGVVWLTPQMDRLFIEGPAARRRFLDRLVLGLDPAHAARVARL